MRVHCNCCGKVLQTKDDMLLENAAVIELEWGYFSEKDGEHHLFRLCEDCYDKIIRDFVIPVEIRERTELL